MLYESKGNVCLFVDAAIERVLDNGDATKLTREAIVRMVESALDAAEHEEIVSGEEVFVNVEAMVAKGQDYANNM